MYIDCYSLKSIVGCDGSYILLACYFVAADYLAPSVLPILLMLLAIDI